MGPDDETRFHDDFICTCGQERRAARDELVAEVMRRLPDHENYAPREVTAERFVTDVIGALSANYGVSIDHIAADQWFLIVADKRELVPGELRVRSAVRVRMQCDDIEGGMAAIWKFFADGAEPVERGPPSSRAASAVPTPSSSRCAKPTRANTPCVNRSPSDRAQPRAPRRLDASHDAARPGASLGGSVRAAAAGRAGCRWCGGYGLRIRTSSGPSCASRLRRCRSCPRQVPEAALRSVRCVVVESAVEVSDVVV